MVNLLPAEGSCPGIFEDLELIADGIIQGTLVENALVDIA
jgi:hypothetical protein